MLIYLLKTWPPSFINEKQQKMIRAVVLRAHKLNPNRFLIRMPTIYTTLRPL